MTVTDHAEARRTRRASRQDGTYPRPQLVREQWMSLGGPWDFAHDDADTGLTQRWFATDADGPFGRTITVPFVPESSASGIDAPGFHPVVWYRRTVSIERGAGRQHLLHFGAVDHSAQVWVDGSLVASHVGGQTAFSADITAALADSPTHLIVVRAYDDPHDHEIPHGKQDWELEPHFIWYRRSTGIWRTVWLESVPEQHVVGIDWATDHPASTVTTTICLARQPRVPTSIRLSVSHDDTELVALVITATDARMTVPFQLPVLRNAQQREGFLWSPENPVLLDANVVVEEDEVAVDEVGSYFGIRSTTVDRGQFLLNNRPYFVRAVLEQGYWTQSHLTAPNTSALRDEVELIKSLGFNAARIHQKVEDPRMLYWADRLGLMIWGETAGAHEYTPRAASVLMQEWAEIVAQNRNHPSIVTWVPINESWGVQDLSVSEVQRSFVSAITSFTRALDPSRPVVSNDGWEHVDSDITTLHDYSADGRTLAARYASQEAVGRILEGMGPQGRRPLIGGKERNEQRLTAHPIMITEFGGISFSGEDTWGYTVVRTDEGFRSQLAAVVGAVRSSPVVAGFCYTQLTDTLQESNGLLRSDRTPKLPIDTLRAIVAGPLATEESDE